MNLVRKAEIAAVAILSISRHDDETVEHVTHTLEALKHLIDEELAAFVKRKAALKVN